ncbi:hypothetical protein [Mesorhizobium sp. CAU 1732]|uniref:hypothetical protein n=1 Tax=Mesorhizobium sp. CAU 1732 TaxID=3140358 RepID=UPI0032608B22
MAKAIMPSDIIRKVHHGMGAAFGLTNTQSAIGSMTMAARTMKAVKARNAHAAK